MKKIILPGIIAGVLMLIAGMVVSKLFNMIFPSLVAEYNNTTFFRPWSDPLMSIFFVHPFILGIALAWVWNKTKSTFKNSPLSFALGYLFVASIPGMVITYSSFQVSLPMIISWIASGFVNALVAGLIFAKMNK